MNKSNYYSTNRAFSTIGVYRAKTWYPLYEFSSFPPYFMNIQHFEKGFHYSDKELIKIAKKIGKLATYCKKIKDDGSFIRIDAEHRETEKKEDAMKVAMTIKLPNKVLRAESRKTDSMEAVDRCVAKLKSQVLKYKETHSSHKR